MLGVGILLGGLNHPAIDADLEALPNRLDPADAQLLAFVAILTEVDLSKRGLSNIFVAEGHRVVVDAPTSHQVVVGEAYQHLLVIEFRLALLPVVANAAVSVRGIRVDLSQSMHPLLLACCVAKSGTPAGRANMILGFLEDIALGIMTIIAELPGLDSAAGDVDAIDRNLPAPRVEMIARRKLANRAAGRALVFVGERLILTFAGTFVVRAALAPDNRLERDASFREGVIGQKPFVGEEIHRLASV